MLPRVTTISCIFLLSSLTPDCCLTHPANGPNRAEDAGSSNYALPVRHAPDRQRASDLPLRSTVKRQPDDGAGMSGHSRNELSSFRDLKYRYMGLGKRQWDPMTYYVGLGKRAQFPHMAAARAPVRGSRDSTSVSLEGGFAGSGRSQRSLNVGKETAAWDRAAGVERRFWSQQSMTNIRKRLADSFQRFFNNYFVRRSMSRRAHFDPKVYYLGIGK